MKAELIKTEQQEFKPIEVKLTIETVQELNLIEAAAHCVSEYTKKGTFEETVKFTPATRESLLALLYTIHTTATGEAPKE